MLTPLIPTPPSLAVDEHGANLVLRWRVEGMPVELRVATSHRPSWAIWSVGDRVVLVERAASA